MHYPTDFQIASLKEALKQSDSTKSVGKQSGWTRLRKNSPWKRGGYVASGVLGFGLVSAAAAAALSLAEIPIRIPIMSELVERILPVASAKVEPPQAAPPGFSENVRANEIIGEKEVVAEPIEKRWREMDRSEKRAVLKARVEQNEALLQERRLKRGLPPLSEAQLRKRRLAIRRALANPETRRPLVKRALRRATIEQRENAQPTGSMPNRLRPTLSDDLDQTTTLGETIESSVQRPNVEAGSEPVEDFKSDEEIEQTKVAAHQDASSDADSTAPTTEPRFNAFSRTASDFTGTLA